MSENNTSATNTNETWDERIKREKAEERIKQQKYLNTALQVAAIIGATVEPAIHENGYCGLFSLNLNDHDKYPGKVSLRFSPYAYKGRIEVSGDYAEQPRYNKVRPHITVADSKTAQQIAKDIQRRFLPDYLELSKECREYKIANDVYVAKVQQAKDRLCKLPGVQRTSYGSDLYINTRPNGVSGKITSIGSDGLCYVELRGITVEQLSRVLEPDE